MRVVDVIAMAVVNTPRRDLYHRNLRVPLNGLKGVFDEYLEWELTMPDNEVR